MFVSWLIAAQYTYRAAVSVIIDNVTQGGGRGRGVVRGGVVRGIVWIGVIRRICWVWGQHHNEHLSFESCGKKIDTVCMYRRSRHRPRECPGGLRRWGSPRISAELVVWSQQSGVETTKNAESTIGS